MTRVARLSPPQLDRVRAAADILLPGSADSPAAGALSDLDELVQQAAEAISSADSALSAAIDSIPEAPTWDSLSAFAKLDPPAFELISLVVVGAYFMSAEVLESVGVPPGLPLGTRRPARPEQVVDELGTGILEAVLERGSPVKTLQDVKDRVQAK